MRLHNVESCTFDQLGKLEQREQRDIEFRGPEVRTDSRGLEVSFAVAANRVRISRSNALWSNLSTDLSA